MFRLPVVLLLTALPLLAQIDPLAAVNDGDRVEVTLKNGTIFKGDVVWCAEGRVKLDVSMESPDTDGSLVFEGHDIARVAKLMQLTADQRKTLLREREERRKKQIAEAAAREKEEREHPATGAPPEKKEELAAKELLAKFPFPDWSEDRKKELAQKDSSKLSDEEREFLARFSDWKRAREKQERDQLVEKFSPGNGWDEKRYAALLTRDPGSLSEDERQFVAIYNQLLKARESKATDDRSTLLDDYPPGADWNENTYDRLKTQFIRLNIRPTDKEQKFVDHFNEWQQALKEKEDKDADRDDIKKKLKEEMDKESQGGAGPTQPPK